jgi:hypothetical protein
MEDMATHQFAAIMGFWSIFFFDLGFWRRFGIEDRFFFFWSSRPISNCVRIEQDWVYLQRRVDAAFVGRRKPNFAHPYIF